MRVFCEVTFGALTTKVTASFSNRDCVPFQKHRLNLKTFSSVSFRHRKWFVFISQPSLVKKTYDNYGRAGSSTSSQCNATSEALDGDFVVVNVYHFVFIDDPEAEVAKHLAFMEGLDINGRIYLNEQGINAQYSGPSKDALAYVEWLRQDDRFSDILVQISPSVKGHAFPRLKLRYKPSLVQLEGGISHLPLLDPSMRATPLVPSEWRNRLEAMNRTDLASEECPDTNYILLDVRNAGNDVMVWRATMEGVFSVKSAYFLIEEQKANEYNSVYKEIWKWRGAERIRVFMWIAFNNRLPTNVWRSTWSSTDAECQYCNNNTEDTLHILRDCDYARQVWQCWIQPRYRSSFFKASLRDWFSLNLKKEVGDVDRGNWSLLWGVSIWKLWKWRNEAIFDANFVKPLDPCAVIIQSWRNYVQVQEEHLHNDLISPQSLHWCPPPPEWIKVNVDGAYTGKNNRARCGGIIRDHNGRWVVGFANMVGACNAVETEQWAVYKGLKLAWEMGFKKVIIESDAKSVVELLSNLRGNRCSLLLTHINDLLKSSWETQLQYIPRDQNRIADALAKEGLMGMKMYQSCPLHLRDMVIKEIVGFNPLVE